MTKCATQTLGMIQLMQDFNIVLEGVVHTDSSAALGMLCLESELEELGTYRYNTSGSKRSS